MKTFGAELVGNQRTLPRTKLLQQLKKHRRRAACRSEEERRARLVAELRKARITGIRVPLPAETLNSKLASLPEGVTVERDRIEVRFSGAKNATEWLYALAFTLVNDYERFEALVDREPAEIVQLREHDSTTAIDGCRIRAAAPPADIGQNEGAFYVIWPHEADTGTGLQEGDYCLVLPRAGQQMHGLVWIELLDEAGTRTVGRKLPQHYETMKGSEGAPPRCALVWKMGENRSETRILSIPISEIHQILPIAAAYDGRPCATRTPNKRMIL